MRNSAITIGEEFRQLRLAKNLSVSDVATATKLQPAYLHAIENMTPDALPSLGYTLGFVRTYAKHLGLDGAEAVYRYKTDMAAPMNIGMRERAVFISKRKIKLPRGFVSAAGLMSCAVVIAVWYGSQSESQAATHPVIALATTTPLETASTTPKIDPNILTVKAIAPSWIQARNASGKVTMSRIMVTGETWQTDRASGAMISARDAGALVVYEGDRKVGPLGQVGMPVTDIILGQFTEPKEWQVPRALPPLNRQNNAYLSSLN